MQDVQVLEGEAARQHQEFIVKGVREHLSKNGEEARLKEFLTASKQFGQGDLDAARFVHLLVNIFGQAKGLILVPTLARLIRHDERRLALLRVGANFNQASAMQSPVANTIAADSHHSNGQDVSPPIPSRVAPAVQNETNDFGPPTPSGVAPAVQNETNDFGPPTPSGVAPAVQNETNDFGPPTPTGVLPIVQKEEEVVRHQPEKSISIENASDSLDSASQKEVVEEVEKPLAERVPLKMRVIADFINSEAWHLAVADGDIVTATKVHDDGWTQVTGEDGGRGMVPTTYLEPVPEEEEAVVEQETVSTDLFANLTTDSDEDVHDVPLLTGQAAVERQRAATSVVRTRLEVQGRSGELEQFASLTRRYAAGQLTAEQLCDNLDQLLGGHPQGAKTCLDLAPLVKDTAKRKALLRVGRRGTAASLSPAAPQIIAPIQKSTVALDPDADDWIEQLRREKLQEKQRKAPNFLGGEDDLSSFAVAAADYSSPQNTHSAQTKAPMSTPQPRLPASLRNKKTEEPVRINSDYMPTTYSAPPAPPSSMTTLPKRAPHQNPFEEGAGAHLDEREILLSRSHGVGAYNPEMIERLQRLKEDEQLAAQLQREEEEAVRRAQQQRAVPQQRSVPSPAARQQLPPNRPAAGTHLHAMPESRQSESDGFWGSMFGGGGSTPAAPAPAPTPATSGADVWTSIFGSESNPRSQQELDDERLARQLQAEEEQRAGGPLTGAYTDPLRSATTRVATSSHAQYQRAPPPSPHLSQPPLPKPPTRETDNLGLFRCGACGETMHVKNAVPGAQFACPICGRLNTI